MDKSVIETILRELAERYPDRTHKWGLLEATELSDEILERHMRYLDEKGLVEVEWTGAGFDARITPFGIEGLGVEVVDKETSRRILARLEEEFPDYVDSQEFLELLAMDEDQLRRPFKYLEQTGFIEVRWYLGKNFRARITAYGIDALEDM